MAQKRHFWESGEKESEVLPNTEFKRRHGLPSVIRNLSRSSDQEFGSILEPFLRKCVKEAIDSVLGSYIRPSNNQTTSCGSRTLELSFEDKLPSTLFTGCRVESEDGSPLKVVLRDARSRNLVTSGSLASARVGVCVLNGDFNLDDCQDWTEQEFYGKTVHEREGRRPLVTGTLSIALRKGVGYIEDITFTDNSSWIRSGKFRLGVKVLNATSQIGIREGISNAFKVKDQRGESYKKHHPPSLVDEVWRLEKISKDGKHHQRLACHGISTVKDFLRLYYLCPGDLRNILGGKISSKTWDIIIGHATECTSDSDELYLYRAADGTALLLNVICQVVGVTFDGQNYQSLAVLNQSQKRFVDNSKEHIYKNLNELVPLGSQPFLIHSLQISQESSSCSPSDMLQNVNFKYKQGEPAKTTTPIQVYGTEDTDRYQVTTTESASQLEDQFTSRFSNNFDTASWQGSGYFAFPGNEALGLISSDFDIHIPPTNGKSKASWCKIRAVVKWRMIKHCSQKNSKASNYIFRKLS